MLSLTHAPVLATKYAAISLVATKDDTVHRVVGEVTKHSGNPLFEQDKPWEPRLDNGYPNVVSPVKDGDAWQLWYGDCVAGCGKQVLLYANSSDGISWTKPDLGIYDISRDMHNRNSRHNERN